ncbi:isoflavonoid glucosyltransferase [Trifolium pratense]|uniref:Isoflavonoid glucosyltransferase n=1 Tax=Trifolium pratense TaxID=57577 RepID=A0A2K3LMV5_TRIPR|nr:isoflavonoid glucosyltransferase [Trifolium pratense]
MDGGDEAIQIRERSQKLAKITRHVVKEGGSSHKNLTALINELKELRHGSAVFFGLSEPVFQLAV